jgi:transposase
MPKRYPAEIRERALAYALEHLGEYPSIYAAAQAIGPKMDVHPASLRQWILATRDLADAGDDEVGRLRRENRELRHANKILKFASAYFAQELVSDCRELSEELFDNSVTQDEDHPEKG